MALPVSASEYYARESARERKESLQSDPVYNRFRYVNFTSESKGKGRKRRHLKGVELVKDINKGQRWFSWHKFPFDDAATETVPNMESPTDYIMERIPRICEAR